MKEKIFTVLLWLSIIPATCLFGYGVREDIKENEYMDSLKIVNLKLEIQLKQLQLIKINKP